MGDYKAFQFRCPAKLYEALKLRADKDRRSLNAEIIVSLEAYFEQLEAEKDEKKHR